MIKTTKMIIYCKSGRHFEFNYDKHSWEINEYFVIIYEEDSKRKVLTVDRSAFESIYVYETDEPERIY